MKIPLPPEFGGRQVEVKVRLVERKEPCGEGLKRCAGMMAADPEFDAVMEAIYQARKFDRPPLPAD